MIAATVAGMPDSLGGKRMATQAIAERGYDAEQVDREIAAERERERALGLDFRRPGSPAQGVQAVPVEEHDAETEDPDPDDQPTTAPEEG